MSRFKIGNLVKDKETGKRGKIIDIYRHTTTTDFGKKWTEVIYCVKLDGPVNGKVWINRYGHSLEKEPFEKEPFEVNGSMKNFHPTLTVYDYRVIYDDAFNPMNLTLATRMRKDGENAIITVGFAKRTVGDESNDKIGIAKAEWRARHNPICIIIDKKWKDISEEYAHAVMDAQCSWLRKYWKEFVEKEKTEIIPMLNKQKKMFK
jgi:hypothetical protein